MSRKALAIDEWLDAKDVSTVRLGHAIKHDLNAEPQLGTVYLAPSGRTCTFVAKGYGRLTFRYVEVADEFCFSQDAFCRLMRVANSAQV